MHFFAVSSTGPLARKTIAASAFVALIFVASHPLCSTWRVAGPVFDFTYRHVKRKMSLQQRKLSRYLSTAKIVWIIRFRYDRRPRALPFCSTRCFFRVDIRTDDAGNRRDAIRGRRRCTNNDISVPALANTTKNERRHKTLFLMFSLFRRLDDRIILRVVVLSSSSSSSSSNAVVVVVVCCVVCDDLTN